MGKKRAIVLSGILLGILVFHLVSQRAASFNPEDAALGPFTIPREAWFNGLQVGFTRGNKMPEARDVFRRIRSNGSPVALWLGASHTYAINRYHPGQETSAYYINRYAADKGEKLVFLQTALPNGNLNEMLAQYLFLRENGCLPEWLIVGVVYDDLREPGVRSDIRNLITEASDSLVQLAGRGLDNLYQAGKKDETNPVKRNATEGTPQAVLEEKIIGWLEHTWTAFASRGKLEAFLMWKQKTLSFEIGEFIRRLGNPSRRVPPVPEDMKKWNEDALDSLLKLAKADKVNILLYKAPHPQIGGSFYHIRKRYDEFFLKLALYCEKESIYYLDLEKLVPVQYWMFDNGLDPWHFMEPGHKLLAEALVNFISDRECD